MPTELRPFDAGEDVLGYELRLDAPPETVFARWVEPALLTTWMGDVATLEPEPGGVFRLAYGSGDVAAGRYATVDAPRHLSFTWGWEAEADFPPGSSTIDLSFEALDGGGTLLRLRHTGVPAELRANVDEGWRYFLPRLAAVDGPGEGRA